MTALLAECPNRHRETFFACPTGVLLLEAYAPTQLGRGTSGPSDPDLLAGFAALTDDLQGLDLVVAREVERDVHEGRFHHGASAVVQIVAMRPVA